MKWSGFPVGRNFLSEVQGGPKSEPKYSTHAAARLRTRTGRREHYTPVLRERHWLPVSRRIDFKLAVLMYQISRGLATTYLQEV